LVVPFDRPQQHALAARRDEGNFVPQAVARSDEANPQAAALRIERIEHEGSIGGHAPHFRFRKTRP
jgi:hypothetical protein